VGFVQHRTKNGSVSTRTHHRYGVRRYGYGLGNRTHGIPVQNPSLEGVRS
jgi:hypothetical protein